MYTIYFYFAINFGHARGASKAREGSERLFIFEFSFFVLGFGTWKWGSGWGLGQVCNTGDTLKNRSETREPRERGSSR